MNSSDALPATEEKGEGSKGEKWRSVEGEVLALRVLIVLDFTRGR